MKLKLNTGSRPSAPAEGQTMPAVETPTAETPGGTKLKLKMKKPDASAPSTTEQASVASPVVTTAAVEESAPPQKKRKYVRKDKKDAAAEGGDSVAKSSPAKPKQSKQSKKRPRDEDGEGAGEAPASKKQPKAKAKAAKASAAEPPKVSINAPQRTLSLKLKTAAAAASKAGAAPTTATPLTGHPRFKLKHKGQPPVRPIGMGYDSEDDDVEEDPATEHEFVLRMQPGEDCDYLRRAIEEKRVGMSLREGGADVMMRFFDSEGRRAVISIQGRLYAATMVDLPCVIEGMKSWDKRGWWKSADICQMLLVIGRVPTEQAAREAPLPREVDRNWQYAHGLTPPMHYVRKRRFRKRVSYRTIEAVEDEVERLLQEDDEAILQGGSSQYTISRPEQQGTESEMMDAEGDVIDGYEDANGDGELFEEDMDEDPDEMARFMEQELMNVDDADADNAGSGAIHPTVEHGHTGGTMSNAPTPASAVTPSAAETTEDDDEEEEEEEIDEEELARKENEAQQREEIEDLRKEVAAAKAQLEAQTNMLLRQRLASKVQSLQNDLELKLKSMGMDADN